MSIDENNGPTDSQIGRRNFLGKMAVISGMAVVPAFLSACGETATPAATSAAAATAPAAATTAATTAAPAATTTAATTVAPPATTAAAATTSGAAATTAGAGAGGAAPAGYDMVGPASSFKADADPVAFAVNGKKGFVFNQAGTLFVFTDVCTHKGCEVPYQAAQSKFVCPCHGSQYDKTGEVVKGPAPARLPKFDYKVVGDTLYAKVS